MGKRFNSSKCRYTWNIKDNLNNIFKIVVSVSYISNKLRIFYNEEKIYETKYDDK